MLNYSSEVVSEVTIGIMEGDVTAVNVYNPMNTNKLIPETELIAA